MSEREDQGTELDNGIKKQIVYELHDIPAGGNSGVNKIIRLLNHTILCPVSTRK